MMIHPYAYLTARARTDRTIRLPRSLGGTSDHRYSQAESGFRANDNSCVDLQRDKRCWVYICVSVASTKNIIPFPSTPFH